MIEAADAIIEYSGRGRDAFDGDSAVREAILYQIVVMGEAAKAVVKADQELANELTAVEWSALAKMRDRLTHQYWALDRQIVWLTVTQDVPEIRRVLSEATERLS